jgi:hypothetical protein
MNGATQSDDLMYRMGRYHAFQFIEAPHQLLSKTAVRLNHSLNVPTEHLTVVGQRVVAQVPGSSDLRSVSLKSNCAGLEHHVSY